jgi:RimJ/RimL family protein N-acetyltransferase
MIASEPDLQPTLTGETLDLRPTRPEDWDGLFEAASDPAIWAVHPAHDRWQEPVFRNYFEDALRSQGSVTIRERATGRIIGASRYSREYAGDGEVEVGWTFLVRDHWGGITNLELKRLMLDHAFRWFDPVIFAVGESNVRSRRALEKIGASLRGGVQHREMAGGIATHVICQIRKADWCSRWPV